MVEKSTGAFAAWSVEIESIEKTTTTFADMEPKVLYAGEKTISTWGDCVTLDATSVAMTSDNNLYILVSDYSGPSCDLRISNNDDWDLAYPSVGYNFLQDVDANDIVTVAMTKAFFDEVSGGSKKQIAVWGNGGFKIKGIATTKETLLNSVTTDAKGYATYSSNNTLALNNLPDGLEAYTAWLDGTTLRFNQKTAAVGSGTGLLIKGGANTTYYIPAKTDATEPDYNALSANLSSTLRKSDDTNYIFVMKKATSGSGSPEFQKLSTEGVAVPAKKAYVQIAKSAFGGGAHELGISFGNEDVTAINAVKVVTKADNRYYNLSGQVVANPTKGIYILNGKKVVIK